MTIRLSRLCATFPALIILVCLLAPDPADARRGRNSRGTQLVYTSSANVLRGQLALERLGHLKRGQYAPGQYDPATREALRDFQRDHSLYRSGWLDQETFALLPVDDGPDEDDDGIPDRDDRCPATKKGARVGYEGCPLKKE